MAALTFPDPVLANKTVVSVAYDRLRQDIMRGVLQPGQKLKFTALSEAYGVGMGTLREALHKLAADGLVEAEERRGFTVEAVTAEQLIDAASVRILLEEEGLRRSIRFGDVEWEVAVLGTFRRLESWTDALAKGPRSLDDQWQAYHRDFHRALVSACRSPTLLDFRDTIFARWERYARLYLSTEQHDAAEMLNNTKEHRAIKDAALARDPDRAAMLLRKHFEHTRELVLAWLVNRQPKVPARGRRARGRVRN
jgi:GntR family transcriptional regulator, carbon starvation induced regulator